MRKIDSLDFFYLAMPEIQDIADGSQDALLVRVTAGDQVGWGECEASPLVTIAGLVCPMSHSVCKPVSASVLGEKLEHPADIVRIHQKVRRNSLDLLQADHVLSGIDVALWDLLGKVYELPVYRLLGFKEAYPKLPYYSVLFGESPQDTLEKARLARRNGFRAVKFGWGPFGRDSLEADDDQVMAAREGLGPEGMLCIDAGAVWDEDVAAARQRMRTLQACHVIWLEEPFHTHALHAYHKLAQISGRVKLAGGEGLHNEQQAIQMINYAGIGYVQIDTGRIGGITAAKRVFDYAKARRVRYVNHTFTSHLALSASLQVYAGAADFDLCEYPGQLSPLAHDLTQSHLELDAQGLVHLPEEVGLGITPDLEVARKYLVDSEIRVNGKLLYQTPRL
ncbi:MAG: mandelate racemase/muconate lactonizing enzyme family protein [Anaerolineaceae bacterium]|jgi:L-alanine-DL-glutamate epimerase-like enolase superfamily enzyme